MKIWRKLSDIIIPTVYADALSYGQIQEKIRCALNQVIEWINNTKFVHSINGLSGDVTLKKLKFSGYMNAEYDGTKEVEVILPVNPDGGVIAQLKFTGAYDVTYDGTQAVTIPLNFVTNVNGQTGSVNITAAGLGAVTPDLLPTKLPNPYPLTIIEGGERRTYDGSTSMAISIPDAVDVSGAVVLGDVSPITSVIGQGATVGQYTFSNRGLYIVTIQGDAASKFAYVTGIITLMRGVSDGAVTGVVCFADTDNITATFNFPSGVTGESYIRAYPITVE